MRGIADQNYLKTEQYKNASNLNARAGLHERFSQNPYGWHLWVFDQFDLPAECRLLELGCGPCYLWRQNIGRVPEGWNITLSDFSPGMLREAREHLRQTGRAFRFETSDAQTIPFARAAFDAVVANHMLYHVPDREKALFEIRRVLKPGGRLYAATNGRDHNRELWQKVEQAVGASLDTAADPFHKNFSLENGRAQLSRWFSDVAIRRYEDALVVTEVDPLVAYVHSSERLSDAQLAAFRSQISADIAASGAVRITKSVGLFIATAARAC